MKQKQLFLYCNKDIMIYCIIPQELIRSQHSPLTLLDRCNTHKGTILTRLHSPLNSSVFFSVSVGWRLFTANSQWSSDMLYAHLQIYKNTHIFLFTCTQNTDPHTPVLALMYLACLSICILAMYIVRAHRVAEVALPLKGFTSML